jgi:predicted dehydrogenase
MKINVGIIGAGRMAASHINTLKKIDNVKIVSICDIVENKAKEKALEVGADFYKDYKIMMDKNKLDAVWICTPANIHSENIEFCIKKDIPFFVEKPVGINEIEIKKIAVKLAKKRLINAVGYQLRYDPAVENLKQILKEEEIIFTIAEWFWTIPLVDSIKSKENAGGQIIDQATHLIDLLRYLVGDIKSVYTSGVKGFFPEDRIYTGDDASGTILTFKNGISGVLVCTYALFPEISRYYPSHIKFISKRKLIQYVNSQRIMIFKSDKYEEFLYKDVDLTYQEDKAFIDAVVNNNSSYIKYDYFEGMKTIKICLACNKSMEKNLKYNIK